MRSENLLFRRPQLSLGRRCPCAGTEPARGRQSRPLGRCPGRRRAICRSGGGKTDAITLRLRAPGAATSAEIADFMQRNPDWPAQAMLERRRQEAIASDPDDALVLAQCDPPPAFAPAMLRCAEAIANAGRTEDANALARHAWVGAIESPTDETVFLRRWGGIATPDDEWARFERLAWNRHRCRDTANPAPRPGPSSGGRGSPCRQARRPADRRLSGRASRRPASRPWTDPRSCPRAAARRIETPMPPPSLLR